MAIADNFNRVAEFPRVLRDLDEGRCITPQPGKCAIIPTSGLVTDIRVLRSPEDGSWALYQDGYDYKSSRIVITREQMFALRALFSQDSWF